LVIQAKTRTMLNSILIDLTQQLTNKKNKLFNKVRWSINVDPMEF
jgi:primosomal protein N'